MKSTDSAGVEVLLCDPHFLVAYKPMGMGTQPQKEQRRESLEEWAKRFIKEKFEKPGNVFLETIHRLDTPVQGLVLFARTSKALSRLQAQQREGKIGKRYLALVEGVPPPEGHLVHYLIHASHHAKLASPNEEGAKKCELTYTTLEKRREEALLQVTLTTGRYHQIRAQLAAMGYPVVGDLKYGSSRSFGDGIALAHTELSFFHPTTHEKIQLEVSKKFTDTISN